MEHQSGWTYLLVFGALGIIGLVLWALSKLFPGSAHTAAGNALMRAEAIFNPSREHVIEAKEYEEQRDDAKGDPPEGGLPKQ